MPKENLKDKLDGNELDLGLNNLTIVPVKDLAALPKATILDLSNNVISILPDSFCTLTHLVKIDLSKNLLTELPENFGSLRNLQHLDLLGNKLSMLPVSFWRLEKLKWLDLKDNPLKDDLKKLAGDCLNETQCKKCAQMILRYMKDVNSDIERMKQRRLQKERELENLQKEKEEEERRKLRDERKAAKERKKQENRLKYQSQQMEEEDKTSSDEVERQDDDENDIPVKVKTAKGGNLCTKVLLSLVMTAIFAVGILYVIQVYCDRERNDQFCQEYGHDIARHTHHFVSDMQKRITYIYTQVQKKFE